MPTGRIVRSKDWNIVVDGTSLPFAAQGASGRDLVCKLCNTMWCEHIEDLITKDLDAPTIWDIEDDLIDAEVRNGQVVTVPLVPSKNQWAHVAFGDSTPGGHKVYLLEEKDLKSGKTQATGEFFLGFFSPGEGRQVLRGMILSWFYTHYIEFETMECKASSHGFAAQMQWKRDTASPTDAFAQYWSVWTTDQCLGCAEISGGFDDLVPEAAAPRFPR